MALESLTSLDKFKAAPFVAGTPDTVRTFYSPVDDVHAVLVNMLRSAEKSIVLAMYGYDDKELNDAIRSKLLAEHIYVQMSLDSSQAAGKAESALLAEWANDAPGNSISIGQSEKHAIQHLKLCIIDGLDTLNGSTNWSLGGEQRQDNQLTILRDPYIAAEARARLDVIHDSQLKAMAAKAKP